MSKVAMAFGSVALSLMFAGQAGAVTYHYCISSDKRPGNVLVESGTVDFGKEWYRERAAQTFCQVNGASGCSATDFSAATCGSLRQETLSFHQVLPNGNQIGATFSGDPTAIGQTAVELLVNTPASVITSGGKAIGKGAHKVCKWFNRHC